MMEKRVVVVDYDDTILPSSFCERWKIEHHNDLPLHFQNMLSELSDCAERFLQEASKYGEVLIITNSDEGWVQFSAERYCPKLLNVVSKYRIVSARTKYEKFYPGQPLCWKAAAFAHEVNEIYEQLSKSNNNSNNNSSPKHRMGRYIHNNNKSINKDYDDMTGKTADDCASMESTDVSSNSSMASMESMDDDVDVDDGVSNNNDSKDNRQSQQQEHQAPLTWTENREIVSFGDSMEERTAVSIVSGQMDAVPKSVKLINSPTLLQIIGQLYMLTNHMQFVCESTKSLDLHITEEQADTCADSYLKDYQIQYDETIVPNYVPPKGSNLSIHNRH